MTATSNIADLSSILPLYQRLSKKSAEEVLSRSIGKLARNLKAELRKIAPEKGRIRSSILALLATGHGIKIRPEVREQIAAKFASGKKTSKSIAGHRLNMQQEMIRREIAVRESGRGVTSVSVRYPTLIQNEQKAVSRFGQLMSAAHLQTGGEKKSADVTWPGLSKASKRVISGLHGPRGEQAMAQAISESKADTLKYVERKAKELVTKTVRAMKK